MLSISVTTFTLWLSLCPLQVIKLSSTSALWLSSCPCSIKQTCPVLLSHQLIAVSTGVGGHCPTSEVTRGWGHCAVVMHCSINDRIQSSAFCWEKIKSHQAVSQRMFIYTFWWRALCHSTARTSQCSQHWVIRCSATGTQLGDIFGCRSSNARVVQSAPTDQAKLRLARCTVGLQVADIHPSHTGHLQWSEEIQDCNQSNTNFRNCNNLLSHIIIHTQCGIGCGTSSSVAGSDRDCVVHAVWEAADVQRQGGRASLKGLHCSNLLLSHISDSCWVGGYAWRRWSSGLQESEWCLASWRKGL